MNLSVGSVGEAALHLATAQQVGRAADDVLRALLCRQPGTEDHIAADEANGGTVVQARDVSAVRPERAGRYA